MLKSTGSAFTNFVRDEYTTLAEVDDRIFSTSVDLSYTFTPIDITKPQSEDKLDFTSPVAEGQEAGTVWDTSIPEKARKVTLETFAEDDSASVQVCASMLPISVGSPFNRHHIACSLIGNSVQDGHKNSPRPCWYRDRFICSTQ